MFKNSILVISALLTILSHPSLSQTENIREALVERATLIAAVRTAYDNEISILTTMAPDLALQQAEWSDPAALFWASTQSRPGIILLLDINELSGTGRSASDWRYAADEVNPLIIAAAENCLNCIDPLLDLGLQINATSSSGLSPLLSALLNHHYDVAWKLIERGADINLSDNAGLSPLIAAIPGIQALNTDKTNSHSAMEMIELLLSKGAKVNQRVSRRTLYQLNPEAGPAISFESGITAVMHAARSNDPEVLKIILDYGADINTRDDRGRTAVFYAAKTGLSEMVKLLYENGAILDYADTSGISPLEAAMGRAGGNGSDVDGNVFHEKTVELILDLL